MKRSASPREAKIPIDPAGRVGCLERAKCDEPAASGMDRFKVGLMPG
jgi:hypothetical protein